MAEIRHTAFVGLAVIISAMVMAQDGGFSKDERITPERLGLCLAPAR